MKKYAKISIRLTKIPPIPLDCPSKQIVKTFFSHFAGTN